MSACISFLLAGLAKAAPEGDRITSLPGWGVPKSPQYSGYLDVSDPQGEMHYHYWLATSSEKDPVVLWLQGGPGATALGYGLLTEMGPYQTSDASLKNSTTPGVPDLQENPYAWSKIANMLFLEAPPSVGFSYCGVSPKLAHCSWNDTSQAVANFNAIKTFFQEFPEYKNNDFYVTGESYGGMYVPTLVEQIDNAIEAGDTSIKLKGFAVGNGVIGHEDTYPGDAGVRTSFLHNKAFISESAWQAAVAACGVDFSKNTRACESAQRAAEDEAGDYYIYNVFDTCGEDQAEVAGREWLKSTAEWRGLESDPAHVGTMGLTQPDVYPCGKQKVAVAWANNEKVRAALHVRPESFYGHPFELESRELKYSRSRAHLLDVYPKFISKYRGLIYNGDFDGCVPYLANEGWVNSLKLPVKQSWKPWKVNGQVAGYSTVFDSQGPSGTFNFVTVKASGHMVPQYKPVQALELFKKFILNQTFAGDTDDDE